MTTMQSKRTMLRIASVLMLQCLGLVSGEIRSFHHYDLEAASEFVHFTKGYIVAPGMVDISKLRFSTEDDSNDIGGRRSLGIVRELEQDGGGEEGGDIDGGGEEGGDIDEEGSGHSLALEESVVDMVLFHLPDDCANRRSGCDWTELGIGSKRDDELRWCCSISAIDFGFCDDSHYGRLLINQTSFHGAHRFLRIPATGSMKQEQIRYGALEQHETGQYVLLFANCNDEGRNVVVDGSFAWKSKHGYLPGDLFGEMYFFIVLTILYFSIFVWYGLGMKRYEESSTGIQHWILSTILMGLLETFFKTGDYFVWNEDGKQFWLATYSGILLGVAKRGISRILVVMVSMGWGVVRDTLGDSLRKIIALGILYIGTSAAREVLDAIGESEFQKLSHNEEEKLYDIVEILTFVTAAIDVTFFLWILDCLNATMEYLDNRNQTRKLQLYLRLRCLLLFSLLFAVVWSIFGVVDSLNENGLLDMQYEWAVDSVMEVNYLCVLTGVAILWRPNPSAKDYAYVMELPAITSEDGGVELEMTDVVPSAFDDDEDEGNHLSNGKGGFRDDDGEDLKIESAVHS